MQNAGRYEVKFDGSNFSSGFIVTTSKPEVGRQEVRSDKEDVAYQIGRNKSAKITF